MIRFLRRLIARLLLRGPLLRAWCARKVRLLETACLRQMEESSRRPPAAAARPAPPPRPPLRKLLFIADILWEGRELVPELEKLCRVETLDLRPVLRPLGEGETAGAVVRALEAFLREPRTEGADAVLFYLAGRHLSPEAFALLRRACPGPLLGMNLDDKVQFWPSPAHRGGGHHYRRWAPRFDLNLTNSRIAADWYADAGAAALYLPPGFRPPPGWGRPDSAAFARLLGFAGSCKPDRALLVDHLRRSGLPVDTAGPGWPGGSWVADPVPLFRSTQLNLGFGLATPRLATMKNRDIEGPGSGSCFVTTWNWELAESWDVGREILCYRSAEELVEIACWHRHRPEVCLAIARRAWDRGRREHTWETRFRGVFNRLGFRPEPPA